LSKVLTQAAVTKLKADPTGTRIVRDAASRGLFLMIQKTGSKSWLMRWRRRGGGEDKIVIGPLDMSGRSSSDEPQIGEPLTLVQARQLAARLNADRAAGIGVIGAHKAAKDRRRIAVAEAIDNSFAVCVKDFIVEHARPKTRGWRETATLLGLTEDLEVKKNGLADRWSDRSIKTIDAHDLFTVIEEARRLGVPGTIARRDEPSESRARKIHGALSQLFSWLMRRRRITANPILTLHAPSAPIARDRVLSVDEIRKFWTATASLKVPYGDVLRLLLISGCRLNEITRLRWDEVSDHVITIPGSRTKNRLPFVLPLPPLGQDIVARQPHDTTYVFSLNSIVPISMGSKIKRQLDQAMDIAPWRFHDLRRTAATGMAEIGIPPHVVEAVLNHVSGFRSGVAGTYNRARYLPAKKAALEKWAAHVEAIISAGDRS
jgi:integrase